MTSLRLRSSRRPARCPARCPRRALALFNAVLILAPLLLLSLSSRRDGKSIVGIAGGIIVASAFDSPTPPSSKSSSFTAAPKQPLFFADDDDDETGSSSNGANDFFFMNNAADDDGVDTSPISATSSPDSFSPRPPSIPPPSRLFQALFNRKAVVLSSTVSGDDPNGGYSSNNNAGNVMVSTLSDAFHQARQASTKALGGLTIDLPTFGGGDINADMVKPFLRMVSDAATKAAEVVAPTIQQIEEEAEEEMVVDVPKDVFDGAIFAALATAHVAAHSPILTAMAGCLAVYAVKSPGLGGDVARLMGSATNSIGYLVAVIAMSTVDFSISSLPDPVENGVRSFSKAVGGAMNAANEGIQENELIQKVVAEAAPTIQSQLSHALEAIGKALKSSAKTSDQYLLAPASVLEDQKERIEGESFLDSTELLDAASAVSANAILQAVTEENQARANNYLHSNTGGEEIDRRWEVAMSETKEEKVDTGVPATNFQRDLLVRQFLQPRSVDISEVEAKRSYRLRSMRQKMLEISIAEKNDSLSRLHQREKRHRFTKIETFSQQAVDAASKAALDSRSTNELLSNLQLISHKPS